MIQMTGVFSGVPSSCFSTQLQATWRPFFDVFEFEHFIAGVVTGVHSGRHASFA